MIKSLLESDEKQPGEVGRGGEETPFDAAEIDEEFEKIFAEIEIEPAEADAPQNLSEISAPADDELISVEKSQIPIETPTEAATETPDFSAPTESRPEDSSAETKIYEPNPEFSEDEADNAPLAGFPVEEISSEITEQAAPEKNTYEPFEIPKEAVNFAPPVEISGSAENEKAGAETAAKTALSENSETIFQTPAKPESFAETIRNSGLAYTAAIILFGSIVFTLILGWFADLLLGSSPWGKVGGIILGAIIGFIQFFRTTSQILKDKD